MKYHECKHCSADHIDDLNDAMRAIEILNDTLTRCQAECTRLLEENRELKAENQELKEYACDHHCCECSNCPL